MYEEVKEKYRATFEKIAEFYGCNVQDIEICKQFGEGKSGDIVLLICVKQAEILSNCGNYVLKILSGSGSFDEIDRTNQVNSHTESRKIVIPILRTFGVEPFYYIYDVAGDELMQATALSNMQTYPLASCLEELSQDLLLEWNGNFKMREVSLYEIMEEWIGRERLAADSRLNRRIREHLTDELTDAFSFDGQRYPNPLYYLVNSDSVLAQDKGKLMCALYGKVHGDLNLNNVIAESWPEGAGHRFYFIDFEQYRSHAPLLFDHAYLLLCVLFQEATDITLLEWCETVNLFFEHLVKKEKMRDINKPLYFYMQAHADVFKAFISHCQEHNRTMVMRQLLAAHVAVGLNFVNKRGSSDRQQKFALLYAASALRVLLAGMDVSLVERVDVPKLDIGPDQAWELWNHVDHFNSGNRYILLTSGKQEHVAAEVLVNMASVDWTMVLEVNSLIDNPVRDQVIAAYKRAWGYRVYDVPEQVKESCEMAPAWVHFFVPDNKPNMALYYDRQFQETFKRIAKATLSMRENETLYIIVDPMGVDSDMQNALLKDILVLAGERTPIHIVGLRGAESGIQPDELIHCITVQDGLAELSKTVYLMRGGRENQREIRIPGKNGFVTVSPEMVANLSNDMVLVHRYIAYGAKDDNGEGFFHGNEATWQDILYQRDVPRLDYQDKWKALLKEKLEQTTTGAGTVVNLYHRAGGGGTTLAKRIALDFCVNNPTVILHTLSPQTAERLKELYSTAVTTPLLVVVEASDGKITKDNVNQLRRELISKEIRVLFLVVSRFVSVEHKSANSNNLYLSDTPDLAMSQVEAEKMFKQYSKRLEQMAESNPDSGDIDLRKKELGLLTYQSDNEELRQPFFYGLYAYGNGFRGIGKYVESNSVGVNGPERNTLNVLAIITLFSQSINLNFEETALFLYPEQEDVTRVTGDVRDWQYSSALVVRRERGIRICHPLIAREILLREGAIRKTEIQEEGFEGTDILVDIMRKFVDRMVEYYGVASQRVNNMFQDLFTHREVIYEEEYEKFSPLMTMLHTRERCAYLMLYVAEKIYDNPHYWNHLARLYLYPVTQSQKNVYADTDQALIYAQKAVNLVEESAGEHAAIHYHVLGKVYTKQCTDVLHRLLNRQGLSSVLAKALPVYEMACAAFDKCIAYDKSGYGLTGKLELITNMFQTMKRKMDYQISDVVKWNQNKANDISQMLSVAGDLINAYVDQFDVTSAAFRSACIRFYNVIGDLDKLESIFNACSVTTQEKGVKNRAISSVLMEKGFQADMAFSYDDLPQNTLARIYSLMDWNIKMGIDNEQDRVRWLEVYRRLPDFSMDRAYSFLMEWPKAEHNVFVCYYRYVIAFLMCEKGEEFGYAEMKRHLIQSETLSRDSYGKNVTISLNYYGVGEYADKLLLPRLRYDKDDSKEKRIEDNKEYRKKYCKPLHGRIAEINNGMVLIRFYCSDGETSMLAKTPNVYKIALEDEGKPVRFFLGFSYSGMRAWDVELEE